MNANLLYTEEEISRCTLSDKREIVFQLRNLLRKKEWVSVSFNEGKHHFLTFLVEVSEQDNRCYFDLGGNKGVNEKFFKTDTCQFSSTCDSVRIYFSGASPRAVRLKGEETFAVPLPKTLLRLQRRDSYRLQLPSARPYFCHVQDDRLRDMALPLYDISVGGFGVQVATKPPFELLERFEDCCIDLREQGRLKTVAEVRYIMSTENRARKPVWHMGCQLVAPTLTDEILLQRFIARIEIERRNLFTA